MELVLRQKQTLNVDSPFARCLMESAIPVVGTSLSQQRFDAASHRLLQHFELLCAEPGMLIAQVDA